MGRTVSRTTTQKRTVRVDLVTTRRATLAAWRAIDAAALNRRCLIGAPLPADWTKATTDDGAPYYLNHATRETQWLDPRLDSAIQELEVHSEIKFAAYRAATKIRDMQVFTRLSQVDIGTIVNAFLALDLGATEVTITVDAMTTVLLEVCAGLPNPHAQVDILVSWLLKMFDRNHMGAVDLRALKVALSTLCSSWLEEKYRYAFGLYDSNGDGFITQEQMNHYLRSTLLVVASIREAWPFGPTQKKVAEAIAECLQVERAINPDNKTQHISLAAFVEWAMKEPRTLIWIPTFHRIAATENSKHEAACSVCTMFPIVGFRYKVMNCVGGADVCQECYWTGRKLKANGIDTANVKEYCFQSTVKQDVSDFSKRVFGRFRKNKRVNEGTVEPGEPVPLRDILISEDPIARPAPVVETEEVDIEVAQDPSSQHLQDEHDAIGELAERMDSMGPSRTPMQNMVGHLEAEQKAQLLRAIDDLEQQNRDLVTQLLDAQDAAASARARPDPSLEDENSELQDKVREYARRNKDLVDQLRRLRAMMANMSGVSASHSQQAPPTAVVGAGASAGSESNRRPVAVAQQAPDDSQDLGPAEGSQDTPASHTTEATATEGAGRTLTALPVPGKVVPKYDASAHPLRRDLLDEASALGAALGTATVVALGTGPPNVSTADRQALHDEQQAELESTKQELAVAHAMPVSDEQAEQTHRDLLSAQLQRLAADNPSSQQFVAEALVHDDRRALRHVEQMEHKREVDEGALAIAAAAVRPDMPQRGYSEERLELDRQDFARRLMKTKARIERELNMTLRGVTMQNVATRLVEKLANGYLLCKLANLKLAAQSKQELVPNRPPAGEALTIQQRNDNFNKFIRACHELGLAERDIPTTLDLQGLEEESKWRGQSVRKNRQRFSTMHTKALRVAIAIDSLLDSGR